MVVLCCGSFSAGEGLLKRQHCFGSLLASAHHKRRKKRKQARKSGSLTKPYVFLSVVVSPVVGLGIKLCSRGPGSWFKGLGLPLPTACISPLKQKNVLPQKWGATFRSRSRSTSSCVRHDILCQATVFKLPLMYFIFISDGGQVIWILMLWCNTYVRCRAPRCVLWYRSCNKLTCFAYKSRGTLLSLALTGALLEIKMWGVQGCGPSLCHCFCLSYC